MTTLINKKILFLTLYTFGLTGGIEKVCRAVIKSLADFEAENILSDYHAYSMYDTVADARYTSEDNFKGFNGKRLDFGYAAIKKGLQSDVMILSHVNLLVFGWIVKKLQPQKRIVLFAHGIEIWKKLSGWKRKFLQHQVEIWAVSQYTATAVRTQHHIPSSNIIVLNNCLDPFFEFPKSFDKSKDLIERYSIESSTKIIFTLSRLASSEQYKGYDQVLTAMKDLPDHYHYLLAGKADDEELIRIKALIAENKLADRVILAGFIPDEDITAHFLLADVFVMPSKAEGFGISFIEAAACGLKVIAGNQDGSRDALLNGALGSLIDPNDIGKITASILGLVNIESDQHSRFLQQLKTLEAFSFAGYKERVKDLLAGGE